MLLAVDTVHKETEFAFGMFNYRGQGKAGGVVWDGKGRLATQRTHHLSRTVSW